MASMPDLNKKLTKGADKTSPARSVSPLFPEFVLQVIYKPTCISPLFLTLNSTDKEEGVKVTFLRQWDPNHLPEEFRIHEKIVDQLFRDAPTAPRDLAFLQFCPPGKAFLPYDKEKDKFVLTISAFMSLVRAFRSDFQIWEHRLEHLKKSMKEGKDKYNINEVLSFSGYGDIYLVATIKEKSHYTLLLELFWKQNDPDRQNLILTYTKIAGVQFVNLSPASMARLAQQQECLLEALGYKEDRPRKKSRQ